MFEGIEIAEYKLIAYLCLNALIALVLAAAVGFWIYLRITGRNKKERAHIQKLKERAPTDARAAAQLAKIERRAQRRRKRNRESRISEIALIGIAGVLCVVMVVSAVPCAIDYARKDYVVYTGDFVVRGVRRRATVLLEDGTVLSGGAALERGEHHGTLVYAKRSEIVLGIE